MMAMDAAARPEDEDRLYGLMEIAERQQAAVQAALDGLAAEQTALVQEREALARGVRDVQIGAQGAVRWAVRSAVAESLAGQRLREWRQCRRQRRRCWSASPE